MLKVKVGDTVFIRENTYSDRYNATVSFSAPVKVVSVTATTATVEGGRRFHLGRGKEYGGYGALKQDTPEVREKYNRQQELEQERIKRAAAISRVKGRLLSLGIKEIIILSNADRGELNALTDAIDVIIQARKGQ